MYSQPTSSKTQVLIEAGLIFHFYELKFNKTHQLNISRKMIYFIDIIHQNYNCTWNLQLKLSSSPMTSFGIIPKIKKKKIIH